MRLLRVSTAARRLPALALTAARRLPALALAFAVVLPVAAAAQEPSGAAGDVPAPASHFGFEIGSERNLANWTELTAYYEKLAEASPRVAVDTLGETVLGRPFVLLTITSADNHARLDELHEIQMKLADPRRISGEAELDELLAEGRTVVMISHAIHSTEVGSAQSAARLAYLLASSDEPRIREILDEVILLDVPALNPDGTEMVVDWYDRWKGTEYEGVRPPFLYHHYVGHDDNRDWYAFTQPETQHTITGVHNAWHPQIVHDIHQMGGTGARIFFPPFVDPWEHNIDPRITSAVNQLGTWMAAEVMAEGKTGVVVAAQYDAFTPARAYQHYHAGARILSETASARLATSITLDPDDLAGRRGFDATGRSWNFPAPWTGGRWGLPQIVDYMTSGALALLTNAARNREYWLRNFHEINAAAVEKWEAWPSAWILPAGQADADALDRVLWILRTGDVEVHRARAAFEAGGRRWPEGTYVVPMGQPYASFAQTMLERQDYPERRQYPGGPPQPPYDVTAHTLPLLMDVEAVPVEEAVEVALSEPIPLPEVDYATPAGLGAAEAPRIAVYKSWDEPMTEGWTRWVLDQHGIPYDTLHDAEIREGGLTGYDVLLLEDQDPESIVEGWSCARMPEPYCGGLGSDGVRRVREFVQGGGRLVAVGEATDFAVRTLGLHLRNAVAELPSEDFYVPGSILRIEAAGGDPLTAGMPRQASAWFWRSSRAFDVTDPGYDVLARYGTGNPLLSGWILGEEHLAGRPALVRAPAGRGSVILFGFPPNYRGQTMATWPLLFNALRGGGAG